MVFSRIRVDRGNAAAALMLSAALLLATLPAAHAQSVAVADVGVRVVDPSGTAIAGAQVKMTETDKQQVHSGATDVTGRYSFNNLPVGPYQLEVHSAGFKSYVQSGIVLQEVNLNIEQVVTMQIGAVTESIQVTSERGYGRD